MSARYLPARDVCRVNAWDGNTNTEAASVSRTKLDYALDWGKVGETLSPAE